MKIYVVPRTIEDPDQWRTASVQVGDFVKQRQTGFTFLQGGRPRLMLDNEFVWFDNESAALLHLAGVSKFMVDQLAELTYRWTHIEAMQHATIKFRKEQAAENSRNGVALFDISRTARTKEAI